jgi:hypothetical protein
MRVANHTALYSIALIREKVSVVVIILATLLFVRGGGDVRKIMFPARATRGTVKKKNIVNVKTYITDILYRTYITSIKETCFSLVLRSSSPATPGLNNSSPSWTCVVTSCYAPDLHAFLSFLILDMQLARSGFRATSSLRRSG